MAEALSLRVKSLRKIVGSCTLVEVTPLSTLESRVSRVDPSSSLDVLMISFKIPEFRSQRINSVPRRRRISRKV
jgi:hypothetical protein